MNTQTPTQSNPSGQPAKKKMSMDLFKIIEKRNHDIVKYILEMKYMKREQIQKKFFLSFDDKGPKYMESALKKLIELKYIYEHKGGLLLVTKEGEEYLVKSNEGKTLAKRNARVWDPIVNHDLKLTDIRMRFEELGFVTKWISEGHMLNTPFLLRTFKDVPDALVMKENGKSVFLELEISKKSVAKYTERVEEYKKVLKNDEIIREGVEGVLFLCTDPAVADVLTSLTEKDKKIFNVRLFSSYIKDQK